MRNLFYLLLLFSCLVMNSNTFAQDVSHLEGRWDLEVKFEGREAPSWLEVRHSGHNTLVGRFVFAFGSARPISEVRTHSNGRFSFSIPRQWEPEGNDMIFAGELLDDNHIKGTIVYTDGSILPWTGVRAPNLSYNEDPQWAKPIDLFNGKSLDGWHPDKNNNQWSVVDGVLTNSETGANLISDQKFTDFKASIEFRVPEDGNSGVYLRGRYEVQIADNYGEEPKDVFFSGIYGFIEPTENMAKKAGEWQSYEIELIGNRVTVIANGKPVIMDRPIPGITGGALDSKEEEPGPFMIQGDHGPIEFRKFEVTPIRP